MQTTSEQATFGRYVIKETLGEGGFATVYRVFDPLLNREVALKSLHVYRNVPADVRRRFLAEARVLASLRHENIVAVYDVGEQDGAPFFTMECINGQTLAELTPPDGMDPALAADIIRQLARAVDYLHQRDLIHRDIKPANIMRDLTGRVVLMDFGVARMLNEAVQTRTGAVLGTPQTMAPEQVRGERVGPGADIYALGVIAYYLLAGRPPFVGEMTRVAFGHVHEPPPPLRERRPDLPERVCAAVASALAKDPDDRPASAGEFAAALGGYEYTPTVDRPPAPAVPPDEVRRASRRESRPPLLAGAILGALILSALVAAVAFGRRGAEDASGPIAGAPTVPAATQPAAQTAMPTAAAQAPTPAPTIAPAPAATTRALLAPGERLTLDLVDSTPLDSRFYSCPGAAGTPLLSVLRITSVERDAAVPDRVRVSYRRSIPAVDGAQCTVPYRPDAGTLDILLETVKQSGADGLIVAVNAVGGSGLSVEGATQLYGRDIGGTWVFDRVDLDGSELRLVQRLENETVLHRIPLVRR